jgi:hypothetical protein
MDFKIGDMDSPIGKERFRGFSYALTAGQGGFLNALLLSEPLKVTSAVMLLLQLLMEECFYVYSS